MRLEGKVAIVSGGAHGMGAVESRLFAREGARVVIADIREDDGRQVEAEINESGGESVFVHTDVTSEAGWANVVSQAVSRFGRLDILVNNAGISSRAVPDDDSLEAWTRIMDINSTGVFSRHETRHRPDAAEWRGFGGQHLFNCRAGRYAQRASGLQRVQGSGTHLHQGDGGAVWPRKHPR